MIGFVEIPQIYQASVACDPDAVEASGGYFHLAGVFLRENKHEIAKSLHDKVGPVSPTEVLTLVPDM